MWAFTVAFFILNCILYLIAERTQVCLIEQADDATLNQALSTVSLTDEMNIED